MHCEGVLSLSAFVEEQLLAKLDERVLDRVQLRVDLVRVADV